MIENPQAFAILSFWLAYDGFIFHSAVQTVTVALSLPKRPFVAAISAFGGGKLMLGRRMFASCAICAAIGLVADEAPAQSQSGLKRTITARHDGPIDGYETLEVVVDLEPDFVIDWHTHPGTEAGYTLEGGGELRVKGEAAQMTKPGATWVIAQAVPHTLKNGSQATKLAITYTVEKGKPLASPVAAPA